MIHVILFDRIHRDVPIDIERVLCVHCKLALSLNKDGDVKSTFTTIISADYDRV